MLSQNLFGDCFELLPQIADNSVNLILIDPPYLISKDSNFKKTSDKTSSEMKTKYNISIDFGDWDKETFDWNFLFHHFYRILKTGGTLVIFYDVWKSTELKNYAEKFKFKQPRVCSWIKTNPVPINSKVNYLSNAIEYFFTFVKGGKPTFNSEYDNGIYKFPICHGKERYEHPTQKPLSLIENLILKHSNVGDLVLDTFAGTFTTAVASKKLGRDWICIEKESRYFEIGLKRLELSNINSL
jgi:site-specific DNA-methyltransferase (adenine-specific)